MFSRPLAGGTLQRLREDIQASCDFRQGRATLDTLRGENQLVVCPCDSCDTTKNTNTPESFPLVDYATHTKAEPLSLKEEDKNKRDIMYRYTCAQTLWIHTPTHNIVWESTHTHTNAWTTHWSSHKSTHTLLRTECVCVRGLWWVITSSLIKHTHTHTHEGDTRSSGKWCHCCHRDGQAELWLAESSWRRETLFMLRSRSSSLHPLCSSPPVHLCLLSFHLSAAVMNLIGKQIIFHTHTFQHNHTHTSPLLTHSPCEWRLRADALSDVVATSAEFTFLLI